MTLKALTRANISILRQKTDFIQILKSRFGDEAANLYSQTCPIVKASVGQHIRHSMDHIELVARSVEDSNLYELHYDLRNRGGTDEFDIDMAHERIEKVCQLLTSINIDATYTNRPIQAYFMLSADPTEFHLPSTIARELGFATHHAIHHMAMVKVIALETLNIPNEELPPDFGRAPSTIVHDNSLE